MKNIYFLAFLFFIHCQSTSEKPAIANRGEDTKKAALLPPDSNITEPDTLPEGKTVRDRFALPEGYRLSPVPEGSFAAFLFGFPLKKAGTPVHHYDVSIKSNQVHAAVLDIDTGDSDLQQCADAVMRLRAEYLYKQKQYDRIHFNFTNGMRVDFSKWAAGYRIKVAGNSTTWQKTAAPGDDYPVFRAYLERIFQFAGTASLAKEMTAVNPSVIEAGDVFIQGGFPGHAVIVMQVAVHETSGNKICLLAQSYMPAQEIHILKNYHQPSLSPWYDLSTMDKCYTPEWTFEKTMLKRFGD